MVEKHMHMCLPVAWPGPTSLAGVSGWTMSAMPSELTLPLLAVLEHPVLLVSLLDALRSCISLLLRCSPTHGIMRASCAFPKQRAGTYMPISRSQLDRHRQPPWSHVPLRLYRNHASSDDFVGCGGPLAAVALLLSRYFLQEHEAQHPQ
eukprot:CAMPEP_0172819832 /NCGR_PEP_ID=MMETSP1075-20121228/14870_1 /TAXON_ID=2916 /ORGANISM="Ceratium fusus, Strain PA161109" /LENGTH=148 /DNA_ID=CAMNT_0013660425 /DNA_START=826 /DNA_END=1272 /DNA_ORIENTATION=+